MFEFDLENRLYDAGSVELGYLPYFDRVWAAVAVVLPRPTGAVAASETLTGTSTVTVPGFVGVHVASETFAGSTTATLPTPAATLAAAEAFHGAAVATLDVTASSAGLEAFGGAVDAYVTVHVDGAATEAFFAETSAFVTVSTVTGVFTETFEASATATISRPSARAYGGHGIASTGRFRVASPPLTAFVVRLVEASPFTAEVRPLTTLDVCIEGERMGLNIGDKAVITLDVKVSGTLTDPSTLKCTVCTPAGVTTEYLYGRDAELTKTAIGQYVCTVLCTSAGQWKYKWVSTGTAAGAEQGVFAVEKDHF